MLSHLICCVQCLSELSTKQTEFDTKVKATSADNVNLCMCLQSCDSTTDSIVKLAPNIYACISLNVTYQSNHENSFNVHS